MLRKYNLYNLTLPKIFIVWMLVEYIISYGNLVMNPCACREVQFCENINRK
jgi:hypothetical protein